MSLKREHRVSNARSGPSLRRLEFSPDTNPLLEPREVEVKRKRVRVGANRQLKDSQTGETEYVSAIHQIIEQDNADFVKVFADGVKAAFGLSKTAYRVFQVVLEQYNRTPMSGGYADAIYIAWFDGGLSGQDVGMSEKTFQTGLRELLAKSFLAPRSPNLFWVNPSLFFKGDRVLFVKEYVRRKSIADQAHREALEKRGQMRIE